MPEVAIVSTMRLCVRMNSSSGTISTITLTALDTPVRITPPAAICDSA